ncbi:MAG: hypothetical protein H7338_24290 [Candidatus Sericytochromatia bacterium]|nr:hypothetical protein [Candidatus Sericytochromatia bacterium]
MAIEGAGVMSAVAWRTIPLVVQPAVMGLCIDARWGIATVLRLSAATRHWRSLRWIQVAIALVVVGFGIASMRTLQTPEPAADLMLHSCTRLALAVLLLRLLRLYRLTFKSSG